MRRVVVAVAMLLLVAASPAVQGTDARTSVPGGLCSLWTTRQANTAMGERMKVVRDNPDACVWYGRDDHGGSISTLSASLWGGDPSSDDPLLVQARASGPAWAREVEVAGVPMLMTDIMRIGKQREITAAAFPDATTWLNLHAYSVIGTDVRRAVRRMVETGLPALNAPAPSIAPAPSASSSVAPPDACALLTEAEASSALGEPVVATAMAPACLFASSAADGSATTLAVAVLQGADAAAATAQFEELGFVELMVGGVPANQSPVDVSGGRSRSVLAVLPDPATVLALSVDVPDALDAAMAARTLAELALPRLAIQPAPSVAPVSPTPSSGAVAPTPSAAARTGFAAIYPSEVAGRPVTIDQELTGRQFLSQIINFEPMEQRITRALKRRDLTVDDLALAIGSTPAGSVIAAFRIDGGRARPLTNILLESLAMERTRQDVPAASVAGKDAFGVTGGFLIGGQGIAYPAGEVLWLVFAQGDEQAEIFEQLP